MASRWAAGAAMAVALAVAGPARAQTSGAPHHGPRGFAEVRLGLMHFDYAEHDVDGAFLDGEKGWVPSLTGEAELRGDRVYGRALLRVAGGTVNYDGQVQSFGGALSPYVDGLPVQADSGAKFVQGEVEVGGLVDDSRTVAIFGGLGARRWSRDIHDTTVISRPIPPGIPGLPPAGAPGGIAVPVSGLSEVYTWFELMAGIRWTFFERPGTTWDVEGRVVRTAGGTMEADLSGSGSSPSNPSVDLGSSTGWRVGSTYRHQLSPNGLLLIVAGWAEGYAFGISNEVPITIPGIGSGFLHEPDSKTTNVGLEVGLGGRF